MNRNTPAIYLIINIINDKHYLGSASNFRYRIKHHRFYLNSNQHHNKYLQRSWNKYEAKNFIFVLVERVESKDDLDIREQYWLDILKCFAPDNGYNIRTNATNNKGVKHSEETKKKMSLWQKGKPKWTEEQKRKIAETNKGKRHTEEAKRKMSLSRKGKRRKKNEKWPHEGGNTCQCVECRKKMNASKRDYLKRTGKNYYQLRKFRKIIVIDINKSWPC